MSQQNCDEKAIEIVNAKQPNEGCGLELAVIKEMMQRDPSYAWSWHCNIAMAYVDAGGDHTTGNVGAAKFMNSLFGIDTSKFKEFEVDLSAPNLQSMRAARDQAYSERNRVVATLARCYPAGIRKTAIEGWDPAWHNCVYIDLPTGQISYHYHDTEHWLFQDLPTYEKPYDGHDKETVHQRLRDVVDVMNPHGTTVSRTGLGIPNFADRLLKSAPYAPKNVIVFVTRTPKGMSLELAEALKNIFQTRIDRLTGLISCIDIHVGDDGKLEAIPRLPDSVVIEIKEMYGQAVRTAFNTWSEKFVIGYTPQDLLDDQKELGLELMFVEPDPTMTRVIQAWRLKGTYMPTTGIYEHRRDLQKVNDPVTCTVQLLGKWEVGHEHVVEACRLLQELNSSVDVLEKFVGS